MNSCEVEKLVKTNFTKINKNKDVNEWQKNNNVKYSTNVQNDPRQINLIAQELHDICNGEQMSECLREICTQL